MKKDILTEQYKNVYTKILPSNELVQNIRELPGRKVDEQKRGKAKKSYVAAGLVIFLLGSTCTGYAVTHASLVKEFFGTFQQSQAAQEYYSEIGKTIVCEGKRYTIEGNLYSEELGKGYLAIKITGKDGAVSDVSWDDGKMPAVRGTFDVLGLKVEKSYVGICFSKDIGSTAKIAKEEDGTYIYIAYHVEADKKDELKVCIQSQDEIQENYQKAYTENNGQISDARTAFDSEGEWTDLTYEKMETVKTEYENGATVWMNQFDVLIKWNQNKNKIENIALVDSNGKRQEVLKNGSLVTNEGQWDGSTLEQSENGDCTLNARFNDSITSDGVKVEFNGQLVEE